MASMTVPLLALTLLSLLYALAIAQHTGSTTSGSAGGDMVDDVRLVVQSSDEPATINSVVTIFMQSPDIPANASGLCAINGADDLFLSTVSGSLDPYNITTDDSHAFDDTLDVYSVQYVVSKSDASLFTVNRNGSSLLPISCEIESSDTNRTKLLQRNVSLDFEIDTDTPQIASTSILLSSDRPAHAGSVIEVQVSFQQPQYRLDVSNQSFCVINNVSVGDSLIASTDTDYILTYIVGEKDNSWKAGELSIYCMLENGAGRSVVVDHFTDDNSLQARELEPVYVDPNAVLSNEYYPDLQLALTFIIVSLASRTIAHLFPFVGLPLITGYIFTGVLVGPYLLGFIHKDQISHLRVVDEISLAIIGLSAGAKLHLRQMKHMKRSIIIFTLLLTAIEYAMIAAAIFALSSMIDFLDGTTSGETVAIALLAGCLMTARSPSSALAVIQETKSRGYFTTLVFTVTVVCDLLVIVLFNINSHITESFLKDHEASSGDFLTLFIQLSSAVAGGFILGYVFAFIISWRPARFKRKGKGTLVLQWSKEALLLALGWALFTAGHAFHPYLEPLLCCMMTGVVMYNTLDKRALQGKGSGGVTEDVSSLLHALSDIVYVCFFTLTGASLELETMGSALVLALALCCVHIVAIVLGNGFANVLAREEKRMRYTGWMAYVTQAGVTLGLAKQVQLLYPGWGTYFSTLIVTVVVLNQILGPPLLRIALRYNGDAKKLIKGRVDGLTAVVLCAAGQTEKHLGTLGRLEACGWSVLSRELDDEQSKEDRREGIERYMTQVQAYLEPSQRAVDAVVVVMDDDEASGLVIRALAHVCHKLKRSRVLKVIVRLSGTKFRQESPMWNVLRSQSIETEWTEDHLDAIDVVTIDPANAADMLIEMAAGGRQIVHSPRPSLAPASVNEEYDEQASIGILQRLKRPRDDVA